LSSPGVGGVVVPGAWPAARKIRRREPHVVRARDDGAHAGAAAGAMTQGTSADLEERLHRFVEHHVIHGERLAVSDLCADRPEIAPALQALVDRYLAVTRSLEPDTEFSLKDEFRLKPEAPGEKPPLARFPTIDPPRPSHH